MHSDNTPPLSFKGLDGQPKGFVVDFWNAWSIKTGIPITIVQTDWPGSLQMMREGKADVHGGLYFSEERDEFLDFTSPYFRQEAVLFVRKSLNIESIAQMGDRYVAVLDQGYSDYWLRSHYPQLKRKAYGTSHEMVKAAVDGEVDALLTEHTTLVFQLGAAAQRQSFVPLMTMYERSLRGAVSKGNDSLLDILEQGIQALSDEEKQAVFHRWIIPDKAYPGWLWPAAGVGFCALVICMTAMLFSGKRRSDKRISGD